jgi:ubiquinol-cytochrome c reductase iron-sulfur subunit
MGRRASMTAPGNANEGWDRRGVLSSLIFAFGAVGVGAVGWALIRSSDSTADLKPLPEDLRLSLSTLPRGHTVTRQWAGRPILISYRSVEDVDAIIEDSSRPQRPRIADDPRLPIYKRNDGRSIRPEIFVAEATCTYHSCVVDKDTDQFFRQGFVCPCCGSRYDRAGRVYSGPAPRNLAIPPYHFDGADTLVIGHGPPSGFGGVV